MKRYLCSEYHNDKLIYSVSYCDEQTKDEIKRGQCRIAIDNDEMTGFCFQSINKIIQIVEPPSAKIKTNSSLLLRNRPVQI